MKINKQTLTVQILLAFFIMLLFGVKTLGEDNITKQINSRDFKSEAVFLSKAEIVKQIGALKAEVNSYEKEKGSTVGEVAKVYTAHETARLFGLYQAINLREHYLEFGNFNADTGRWEGFQLKKAGEPYHEELAAQAITRLEKLNVPMAFLKGFKIFLLPYAFPEISGLGGAGFTLLSAPVNSEDPAGDLAVTLYHEIGHHIHLSFMPHETKAGKKEWNQYLQIKGGTWHGPGDVNTTAWSDSSEETFAEDFRMLFDKEQPFFGDVSLGDPRNDAKQAERLKNFIIGLADEKTTVKYSSPWIPVQNPYFSLWQQQGLVILSLWFVLGSGIGMIKLWSSNNMPDVKRLVRHS